MGDLVRDAPARLAHLEERLAEARVRLGQVEADAESAQGEEGRIGEIETAAFTGEVDATAAVAQVAEISARSEAAKEAAAQARRVVATLEEHARETAKEIYDAHLGAAADAHRRAEEERVRAEEELAAATDRAQGTRERLEAIERAGIPERYMTAGEREVAATKRRQERELVEWAVQQKSFVAVEKLPARLQPAARAEIERQAREQRERKAAGEAERLSWHALAPRSARR